MPCVLRIIVRPNRSRKLVKEACKPSCGTELPSSDIDDLPSRGQLVNQAAEHEFRCEKANEREKTHIEKYITHKL